MNQKAIEAGNAIKEKIQLQTKMAIVLGSGLGNLVDAMTHSVSIKYGDIPNFPTSSVQGHKGELVSGKLSGVPILAFSGRVHYYEGYTLQEVVFPVAVMSELGITNLIITNASGAINQAYSPGDIVIIRDHINLIGDNPLRGAPLFTDMTEAYPGELRELAKKTAEELKIQTHEGIYLALSGPSYETPAEIRMLRNFGADLVGMSTVPEVIVGVHMGMQILGVSVVTDLCDPDNLAPVDIKEIIQTANEAGPRLDQLIEGVISKL